MKKSKKAQTDIFLRIDSVDYPLLQMSSQELMDAAAKSKLDRGFPAYWADLNGLLLIWPRPTDAVIHVREA